MSAVRQTIRELAEDYWRTHVVNVAMAIKQPAVQYRQTGDELVFNE